jgi:hypothetical protein
MTDLHTRLQNFAGPIEAAPAEVIEADLARGHRALRRRRTVQTIAGSAFGIAAIVAAFAFTGASMGDGSGTERAPAVAQSATGGLKLVDYSGTQPKFFTVDKVPEGYFIQNDDEGGLTIAPDAVQHPSPGIDPSKAPMYNPRDLGGKIGIYLERKDTRGNNADGEKVTVAGHPAIMHPIGPTWQLLISVSPDVYATIQFDVSLSRPQMLELGAGLHVHQEAIDRMAASIGK